MKAIMNLKDLKNTQELQTFLMGSQAVAFSLPGNKKDRYHFIQSVKATLFTSLTADFSASLATQQSVPIIV